MQPGRGARGIILTWFLYLTLTSFLISYGSAMETNTSRLDSLGTGPTISWHPEPIAALFIDGAYNGESRETFEYWVWVNDSLGVDSVVFRFKWSYDDEWLNRTTALAEGDEFLGRYEGNLTWPAPGGGVFQFKVFANNTLGYWNETSPMTVHFGYMYWNPIYTPFFWIVFVIIPVVSLVALVGVLKLRRKLKASGHVESHLLLDSPKCNGLLSARINDYG